MKKTRVDHYVGLNAQGEILKIIRMVYSEESTRYELISREQAARDILEQQQAEQKHDASST